MTDVQPNPDRDEDLETSTPQPDENPQQRENLRDQVQRRPGQDEAAPATGGDGAAGAGGKGGFGTGA